MPIGEACSEARSAPSVEAGVGRRRGRRLAEALATGLLEASDPVDAGDAVADDRHRDADRLAVEVGEECGDVLGEQAGAVAVAAEDLGWEAEAGVGGGGDFPVVVDLLHLGQPSDLGPCGQGRRLDRRLEDHLRHLVNELEAGGFGSGEQIVVLRLIAADPDAEAPSAFGEEALGAGHELLGVEPILVAERSIRDHRVGRAAGAEDPAGPRLDGGVGIELEQLP